MFKRGKNNSILICKCSYHSLLNRGYILFNAKETEKCVKWTLWPQKYLLCYHQLIFQTCYFILRCYLLKLWFLKLFFNLKLFILIGGQTWIHHGCTRVLHPEPPSDLPPHTIPLGHPSAPAPSFLYPASYLDWWFISYMILYMF